MRPLTVRQLFSELIKYDRNAHQVCKGLVNPSIQSVADSREFQIYFEIEEETDMIVQDVITSVIDASSLHAIVTYVGSLDANCSYGPITKDLLDYIILGGTTKSVIDI